MFDSVAVHDPPVPRDGTASMPLEALEREICELAAHLAAGTCRWLLLVAEWDERRAWAEWGVRSCAHWLSWRCSIGLVAARQHVRVGRRLLELPLVRDAFARGELSYCKVRALCRIATPETEESLVELALHATGAQLEKFARGYRRAQSASLETARRAFERRRLDWHWDDDGSLHASVRLPADDGALFLKAIEAFEEFRDGEFIEERQADALMSLTRAALAGEQRAPCELVVHVDAETLTSDRLVERCEAEDGPALAPETVRRLGCDAAITRIIERGGEPLSIGRRTRAIPPALRRALRSRDGGCRFPGCTHRRFLHAHHIEHWARGGATDLDNLIQLCSHHHRLVHEGGFGVERAGAGMLRFRRPDGRVIPAVGHCTATGPPLARRHRVAIDQTTCMPRSAGDPLDYGLGVEVILALEARAGP